MCGKTRRNLMVRIGNYMVWSRQKARKSLRVKKLKDVLISEKVATAHEKPFCPISRFSNNVWLSPKVLGVGPGQCPVTVTSRDTTSDMCHTPKTLTHRDCSLHNILGSIMKV
jgi:hypothetical protein